MDLQTLHYLAEDRFTLVAFPTVVACLLQVAGLPDPGSTLGLRVGHTTKTLRQAAKAMIGIFNKSAPSFPSLAQWKPLLMFQFVHNDFGHFAGNFLTLGHSILFMKFPSWAAVRGWRRGGFLSFLMTSGSIVGALTMDASYSYRRSGGNQSSQSLFQLSNSAGSNNNNSSSNSNNSSSSSTSDYISSNFNYYTSTVASYIPSQVSDVFSWASNQLPASNWHQDGSSDNNKTHSFSNFTSSDDGDGSSLTSKLYNAALGKKEQDTFMLGISAATFSVIGYNLTYDYRPEAIVSAAMILGNTILGTLTQYRQEQQLQKQQGGGGGISSPFSSDAVITAHYAHLGGFVWGAIVGYVCRAMEKRRLARLAFRFNDANGNLAEDDGRGNRGRRLGGA